MGLVSASFVTLFLAYSLAYSEITPSPDAKSTGVLAGAERDTAMVVNPDTLADTLPASASKPRSFDLYDVSEMRLAKSLWMLTGHEGEPTKGRYRVMVFTDSAPKAYFLRGGTQIGQFPDSALPWLRGRIRSGELKRGGDVGFRRNFWNASDPIEPYMWKTGLDVRVTMSGFVSPHVSPQFERRLDMTFAQKPLPWIITELGGHLAEYGGGISRYLEDPFLRDPQFPFWGTALPWWHVALGLPAVKWELALANRPLPDLYWLEPNASSASYLAGRNRIGNPVAVIDPKKQPRGSLMREWRQDGDAQPSGRNFSQAVHVKAGDLQYSAYFDPDVYRSVVHKAYFEGLPAPMGTWGFGFYFADGIGQSLFGYDFARRRIGVGDPADGNILESSFLHVELAYRDHSRYRLAVSTHIRLDSRTFSYGDSP